MTDDDSDTENTGSEYDLEVELSGMTRPAVETDGGTTRHEPGSGAGVGGAIAGGFAGISFGPGGALAGALLGFAIAENLTREKEKSGSADNHRDSSESSDTGVDFDVTGGSNRRWSEADANNDDGS